MKWLSFLFVVVATTSACGSDEPTQRVLPETDCGFPQPTPGIDESQVPKEFLIQGSRVSSGTKVPGGYVTTIDVPYSVQDALPIYKDAVAAAGFKTHSIDNEGFEAEVYFEGENELGALQIRRSTCPDASLVYVNIVARRSLSQPGKSAK